MDIYNTRILAADRALAGAFFYVDYNKKRLVLYFLSIIISEFYVKIN